MKLSSPRTTWMGLLSIALVVLTAVKAAVDNDPTTSPDFAAAATQILAAIGLIFARDNLTSDQQAGVRPET